VSGTSDLQEEAIALLSELVACPSVNPGDRQEFMLPFGEGRLVALLTKRFESWGAGVQVSEVAPGRPNLLARWPGRESGHTLLLEAHGDTVSAEGMEIDPFNPVVREGRLYGRGACDTKGPMTAMLMAIREILDRDGRPPVDLCFACTADEEHGGSGARKLVADGFTADAAIVAEPTGLAIATTFKGAVRWRLRTHGIAAHTASPEDGVNAIEHMARVIGVLSGRMRERLREKWHPLLGSPTICVGTIAGGTQVNVVPAECAIEIDRRMLPGEEPEALLRELEREMNALTREVEGLRFSIEQTEYYPPLEHDPDSPLVGMLRSASERCLGRSKLIAAPCATDAGIFDEAGIPSVVFGPGSMDQAHKSIEFIDINEVCRAVEVLVEFIRGFAG